MGQDFPARANCGHDHDTNQAGVLLKRRTFRIICADSGLYSSEFAVDRKPKVEISRLHLEALAGWDDFEGKIGDEIEQTFG
jgi:hypothetical protein